MGWLKTWGVERTRKYLQGISKNDVVVRKGHTLLTQLLCAGNSKGDRPLRLSVGGPEKYQRLSGGNLLYRSDTGDTEPPRSREEIASALCFGAAHGLLALCAGTKILAEFGRLSARRDVRPIYPDLDTEAKGVRVLLLTPEDAVQLEKPYQQLREEFLLKR